jgi:hypothetical protein
MKPGGMSSHVCNVVHVRVATLQLHVVWVEPWSRTIRQTQRPVPVTSSLSTGECAWDELHCAKLWPLGARSIHSPGSDLVAAPSTTCHDAVKLVVVLSPGPRPFKMGWSK